MNRFLHTVIIGTALLVSSVTHSARATTSSADAATYFSNLADDEKETYTSWFTKQAAAYSRHSFMPSESSDTDSGAAFFWNINDDDTVSFALAVRADGWVGFGISEAGGMMGADMALYQVSFFSNTKAIPFNVGQISTWVLFWQNELLFCAHK